MPLYARDPRACEWNHVESARQGMQQAALPRVMKRRRAVTSGTRQKPRAKHSRLTQTPTSGRDDRRGETAGCQLQPKRTRWTRPDGCYRLNGTPRAHCWRVGLTRARTASWCPPRLTGPAWRSGKPLGFGEILRRGGAYSRVGGDLIILGVLRHQMHRDGGRGSRQTQAVVRSDHHRGKA